MTDKTVLITGCSSGIGRATAEAFEADDWQVYATARNPPDIGGLEERGCETAALDVTEPDDVDRVIDRIKADTGRVDCLINNAGYGQYGPLEDITEERLEYQFDVNVYGPHRMTRAVLPMMREREDGTIINLSSINGRISYPGSGAYSGSKFALEAMSDALRLEVDRFGVDVVLVEPGPVATDFNDRLESELDKLDQTPAYDWLYNTIVDVNATTHGLPFTSEPEDVATLIHDIAHLSDPDPRYPVGPFAKFVAYSSFLPDRFRDGLLRTVRRFI